MKLDPNLHPDDTAYVVMMLVTSCVGVAVALIGCYVLLTQPEDTGLAAVLSITGFILAGLGLGEFNRRV